jgi:hypothetical protein
VKSLLREDGAQIRDSELSRKVGTGVREMVGGLL